MNGKALNIARIKAGLKQWQMAQRLGISQQRLWEFENNARTQPPELLEQILQILHDCGVEVPEHELF